MNLYLVPSPAETPPEFEGLRVTHLEERFGPLRPAAWFRALVFFIAGLFGSALGHVVFKAIDGAVVTAMACWR